MWTLLPGSCTGNTLLVITSREEVDGVPVLPADCEGLLVRVGVPVAVVVDDGVVVWLDVTVVVADVVGVGVAESEGLFVALGVLEAAGVVDGLCCSPSSS